MKPLKLTMSAFGSYGKEITIDFTKVDHGLFLITGDTGSGKTTIFDGITFAVYGETSGGKRDGKMMRSQFATPADETFVELTFSYRGDVYTVRRSPEYMREKKRGSGLVKAAAAVELIMPDGTAFRGKTKETDKKLCEIMGIDREQFTQIAMIAQGDFLRLLHAKSEERKKIFSTIFHTGLYRKVEEELWEQRKVLKEKIGGAGERLKAHVQGIQVPEILGDRAFDETLDEACKKLAVVKGEENPDPAVICEILEQFLTADENMVAEISEPLDKVEKQYRTMLETRGIAQRDNDILERLGKAREKQQSYIVQEDAFIEQKTSLEQAERAHNVRLFFDKWMQAEKKAAEAKRAEEEEVRRYQMLYSELLRNAEPVLKPEQMYEFSEMLNRADNHEIMAWTAEWKAEEKMLEAAKQKKLELNRRAEQIERFGRGCEKRAEELNREMALLSKARDHYGILQEQFLREQAGILAKERLAPGIPCPVCGSLEHPSPAVLPENAVTEAEVRNAQEHWEKKRTECERMSLEIRGDRAKLEEAREQLERAQKEIPANYEARRKELEAVITAAGRFLKVKERLEQVRAGRERLESGAADGKYEYEEVRKNAGFADEKAYLDVMHIWPSKPLLEQEKKNNAKYFTELQELRTMVQTLEQQAEGMVYTDLTVFDTELTQWKEKKDDLQEQKEQAVRNWKNHDHLLKMIRAEEKEYSSLLEDFLLYDSLWQVAAGRIKGQVRLDFETYVQRMYFEKILAAANKRFLVFTDGKMKLKSRPMDEMGLVGASGLDINVYVMATGKERDVKTLSGGESFLASLALALGLSDVVQSQAGSIRLESMFVDEGFGALDDNTREQAMRVLNELAGDDRLVGIISHVNTLKDSIERKLVVKRGLNGSSASWC